MKFPFSSWIRRQKSIFWKMVSLSKVIWILLRSMKCQQQDYLHLPTVSIDWNRFHILIPHVIQWESYKKIDKMKIVDKIGKVVDGWDIALIALLYYCLAFLFFSYFLLQQPLRFRVLLSFWRQMICKNIEVYQRVENGTLLHTYWFYPRFLHFFLKFIFKALSNHESKT